MSAFKQVPGFPLYQVTREGRVLFKGERYVTTFCRHTSPTVLVAVGSHRKRKVWTLAALVLEAFRGPPPLPAARPFHRDGDRNNNALHNLRWGTPSGEKPTTGRRRGEEAAPALLTTEEVLEIRGSKRHQSLQVLADYYGVSKTTVRYARIGVTWQHLPPAGDLHVEP